MKAFLIINAATLFVCGAATLAWAVSNTQPATTQATTTTIALAGDSTVTDAVGWAPGFRMRMTATVRVSNFSESGRSSKSYRDEGHWAKVLAAKPDYLIIQFGHNDMPGKGPQRETDPATTYRKNMEQYVDEARAAGIIPILATSIARREFKKDDKIHSTLTPWTEVVKLIAAEKHVPLLDLHARTIALYEQLGPAGCDRDISRVVGGKIDHTHLSPKGAEIVGDIAADELRTALPQLQSLITPDVDPPATQPKDKS